MNLTFSNFLTILRIILIPFITYAMIMHNWDYALLLFSIAAITDFFDGYLARLWNQESVLGRYLDPFADKLFTISCYTALVLSPLEKLIIPQWFLYIVIIKELILIVGGLYLGICKKQISIKPTLIGKIAMTVQSFFIAWLLACSLCNWAPVKTFSFFLGMSLVFIIVSLMHYMASALTKTLE